MPTSAEMELVVKATVNQATQGLQQVQQGLAKTSLAATKLDSSLQTTSRTSGVVGQALVNLGRVAQDAPFGFIAIQNNLNPLLESFQRLQQVSKDTGTSLTKNLVGALIGPAGLGLALSAVSFIALKYPDLFSTISDETRRAAEAQKAYVDALAQAGGALQTELTKLSALIQVARDTGESTQTRTNAIKELQKEYPDYLKNLSLETINSQAAQKAIDDLVGSLERKAKAQALSNLITAENEKLIKLQNSSLSDQVDFFDALLTSIGNFGNKSKSAADLVEKASKDRASAIKDEEATIANYNKQFAELLTQQAKGGDFKFKTTGVSDLERAAKILAQLKIDREHLQGDWKILQVDKPLEDIKKIEETIKKLESIKGTESIKIKLQAEIDNEALAAVGGQLQKQFGDLKNFKLPDIAPPAIKIPIEFNFPKVDADFAQLKGSIEVMAKALHLNLPVNFDALNLKELKNLKDQLKDAYKVLTKTNKQYAEDFNKSATDVFQHAATDIFAAFGQGLGDAASGAGFQNLFKGVTSVIGSSLQELGKEMIALSPVITALKLSLKTLNPALLLPAGIALEAIGTIIKNSLGKGVAFAEGGIVTAPVLGLIGERGKEAVMPLDKLNEFVKRDNQAIEIIVKGELSGDKLKLLVDRVNRRFGRTY